MATEVITYDDDTDGLAVRILMHCIDALRTRPIREVLGDPGSLWDGKDE
jgi:hypothetical protein